MTDLKIVNCSIFTRNSNLIYTFIHKNFQQYGKLHKFINISSTYDAKHDH